MRKLFFLIITVTLWQTAFSSDIKLNRVEPMFWWVGMKNPKLQLMAHGNQIAKTNVEINYEGVGIESVAKVENPNYLFINLNIGKETKPGTFKILFSNNNKTVAEFTYELKQREKGSACRVGFNPSDVIYLITPDRFVNGDTSNDEVEGMKEKINMDDITGRHGGDIRGIINSLGYLQELGFTAIWLNPVLENNMSRTSYHGYSTTDFYKIDPRFGTNEEYVELNKELDKRGMKLIMDMIFNHCGSEHWWMGDMPMPGWINNNGEYIQSNHRRTVNQDPYASDSDKKALSDGWFVESMPDLNQRNPFMATYLIQNSIWWIEYAGLEGIRQDTWPYPDKDMMAGWTKRVLEEYPGFNIVGEEWSMNPAIVSYWQNGQINNDGYKCYLPSLMDFPLQNAVSKGLKAQEEWGKGLIGIYEMLANDFLYPNPGNLVIFPDNHDMPRFYKQVGEDVDLLKMGLAFFFTSRGIPQIYYGTEILMSHKGDHHGEIRADYPGGWQAHKVNAFTGKGLNKAQKGMQQYIKTILNWRKDKKVIHNGELKHFTPEQGIYTYFRYNADETVMVVINKNYEDKELTTQRFSEVMGKYTSGKDIISSTVIDDISSINILARSAMIIELIKPE